MEIDLQKVDIVRERTKVGYAEAKDALEKTDGNVLDAIIYIEKNQKNVLYNLNEVGSDFVEKIKDIVKKGNVNRIKIKKDGKAILDIPVSAGVVGSAIGVVYIPALVAIGAVAAVLSKIEIEIERPGGKVEIVDDLCCQDTDNVQTSGTTGTTEE